MKAIDYIQCKDCVNTINEFLDKSFIDRDSKEAGLIAEFALLMEIKRLKMRSVKLIPNPLDTVPYLKDLPPKRPSDISITC